MRATDAIANLRASMYMVRQIVDTPPEFETDEQVSEFGASLLELMEAASALVDWVDEASKPTPQEALPLPDSDDDNAGGNDERPA